MNRKILAMAIVAILVVAAIGIYVTANNEKGNKIDRELLNDALEVYGNADNDWTIDQKDADFVQSIIDGKIEWNSDDNPYADANHDGKITQADVDQINQLAKNDAEFVWIKDGVGTEMKVGCKPQRIYTFQIQNAEIATIMGYGDKIVAGGPPIEHYEEYLFPDNPNNVQYFSGDYERLSELNIDLYLVFSPTQIATPSEKLPDTDVVYLGLYYPKIADMESSAYAQGILKAGYIFGDKDRAEGYLDFLLNIRDTIYESTKNLSESEKPNVLVSQLSNSYFASEDNHQVVAYTKNDTVSQAVALAGGRNAASNVPTYDSETSYSVKNDVEWLDELSIDFVTVHFQRYAWTGIDNNSPEGGYTATDQTGMYKFIDQISSRPLLKVDRNHIIMLPQENRHGSSGGIMCAAYLFKAFHPDLAENFDPDAYMSEYLTKWLGIDNYDYSEHKEAIIAWGDRFSTSVENAEGFAAKAD